MAHASDPGSDHLSYYAVLNVAPDASADEIKRAYRALAQVFHPDKHASDDLRDKAQEAFARLQEAYEVLSDEAKREVYDIYGQEGLAAGLQVGAKLRSVEEMRKEWAEFKARSEKQKLEAGANHRGYYLCRIDATGLVAGNFSRLPPFRYVVVQNAVDVPLGGGVVHLQGQAALKGTNGLGVLVAGYKRPLGQYDEVEVTTVLGPRPMLTATSSRRLGTYTTAALTASYTSDQGLGLQLASSRQLTESISGSWTWVVGPPGATGMSIGIVRRGSVLVVSAKLDVGALTAISAKLQWIVSEATSIRLGGRLGLTGADVELGVARRFSPISTGYMGTAVGLSGVTMKVRYARSGQVFEFPIVLSTSYADWRVLTASAILPPLTGVVVLRFIVRPIAKWRRTRAAKAEAEANAEEAAAQQAKARREQSLLAPVARRKAVAEASQDGLVVLEAVYGVLEEWRAARLQRPASSNGLTSSSGVSCSGVGGGEAATAGTSSSAREQQGQQDGEIHTEIHAAGPDEAAARDQNGRIGSEAGASTSAADTGSREAAAAAAAQPPQRWLDVRDALQYLVHAGKLELHSTSKQGLMGFADVARGADKCLYVLFSFKRQLMEKEVGDSEALRLPAAGVAVRDVALVERMGAVLAELRARAVSGGGAGSADGDGGASSSPQGHAAPGS